MFLGIFGMDRTHANLHLAASFWMQPSEGWVSLPGLSVGPLPHLAQFTGEFAIWLTNELRRLSTRRTRLWVWCPPYRGPRLGGCTAWGSSYPRDRSRCLRGRSPSSAPARPLYHPAPDAPLAV